MISNQTVEKRHTQRKTTTQLDNKDSTKDIEDETKHLTTNESMRQLILKYLTVTLQSTRVKINTS